MTTNTSASPMRRDMERQPEVLADLLRRADAFRSAGAAVLAPGVGGRIFVCGCGDGLFAAQAATGYAETLGLDWRAVGPLDLMLAAADLRDGDRIVSISMSGNVDRTVEAAQAIQERGAPLLALVNGDGGRLGSIATRKISLELADVAPFLCGTASYTATILALMLLAQGAAGRAESLDIGAIGDAIGAALRAADAVTPALTAPTGVRFQAAGVERGTARYAAAKCVELTRIPAWSADLEEFAHSQYWTMPATDLVVMIASQPAIARYANLNCEALRDMGVVTLAIDTPEAPIPSATHRITVPAAPAALSPLAMAAPVQALAAGLARMTGLDPDTRLHLKNDTLRFRVSRLLTRRSLLGTGQ